jgi:elongation factor P hydroxylase
MRLLTKEETRLVSGGDAPVCTPADAMNDFYGIQNTTTFGQDLVNIYEGLVFATSHVIERVFAAFKD